MIWYTCKVFAEFRNLLISPGSRVSSLLRPKAGDQK